MAKSLWPAYRGLKPDYWWFLFIVGLSLWPAYRGLKHLLLLWANAKQFSVCDPLIGDWNTGTSRPGSRAKLSLWPAYRGLKQVWKCQKLCAISSLWPAYRGLKQRSNTELRFQSLCLWPAYRGLKHILTHSATCWASVCDPLIGDWNPSSSSLYL